MKKISSLLSVLCVSVIVAAQTLNPTNFISSAGAPDAFKGGYTFSYASSGTPWNGSLISFGGFSNNYDTQINADYGPHGGNRMSFRTRNGDTNMWNSWHELATRGENNFRGHQTILGKLGIGGNPGPEKVTLQGEHESTTFLMHADNGSSPHAYFTMWASEPQISYNGVGIGNNIRNYHNGQAFARIDNSKGGAYMRLLEYEINFNMVSPAGVAKQILILRPNGNAALQGKFEASEVKVTTTPTADFVFDDDYQLPLLEVVEKHIKQKKHLPEIASAKEMENEGVNIGEFQIKLLQKIEELTLYAIEQNKLLKDQAERIKMLENNVAIKNQKP